MPPLLAVLVVSCNSPTTSQHPKHERRRVWDIRADRSGDAPTIQAGIDSARSGDSVLVAAGNYTWTSQGAAGHTMIVLKRGVSLLGRATPESVIVDAQGKGRVILCYDVGDSVTISHLTVQNGVGKGSQTPLIAEQGAGILCNGGSNLKIVDCIIRKNRTLLSHGAGVSCVFATITNCQILDNAGSYNTYGAGISCSGRLTLEGCTIRGNSSFGDGFTYGGGVSTVHGIIRDCLIVGNSVSDFNSAHGAGLDVDDAEVTHCTLIGNTASSTTGSPHGGGVNCRGSCVISDCLFIGNAAIGGVYPGGGGAIGATTRAHVTITGCTLAWNRAAPDPGLGGLGRAVGGIGLVNASISGCIIAWSQGFSVDSVVTTRCCDFYGSSLGDSIRGRDQGGNFSADPRFCAPDSVGGNFALRADSPCAPGRHPAGGPCDLIGAFPVECDSVSSPRRTNQD